MAVYTPVIHVHACEGETCTDNSAQSVESSACLKGRNTSARGRSVYVRSDLVLEVSRRMHGSCCRSWYCLSVFTFYVHKFAPLRLAC